MLARQVSNRLTSIGAARLLARDRALQHLQVSERVVQIAGAVRRRAIRQRKRVGEAQVHPYRRPIGRRGGWLIPLARTCRCWAGVLQQDLPAVWLAHHDDVFEHTVGALAMPAYPDRADVLHVQAAVFQLRPVARFVAHAIEASGLVDPVAKPSGCPLPARSSTPHPSQVALTEPRWRYR